MSAPSRYTIAPALTDADFEPVAPKMFAYRPLADVSDATTAAKEMGDKMREDGAVWCRFTIKPTDEPPYPAGLYVEGWRERPRAETPFNFPLTETHP